MKTLKLLVSTPSQRSRATPWQPASPGRQRRLSAAIMTGSMVLALFGCSTSVEQSAAGPEVAASQYTVNVVNQSMDMQFVCAVTTSDGVTAELVWAWTVNYNGNAQFTAPGSVILGSGNVCQNERYSSGSFPISWLGSNTAQISFSGGHSKATALYQPWGGWTVTYG